MANDDTASKRSADADIRYSYSYSYSYSYTINLSDDTASKRSAEVARARFTINLQRAFSDFVSELERSYRQPAHDAADTRLQHALLATAQFLERMGPDYLAPSADQFANLAQTLSDEVARKEALLSALSAKDDPGLSAIDNKRRRYARILWALRTYFDKLPELKGHITDLATMFEDLNRGVTDQELVAKGSKRDSMRIWGARMQAALGLGCFIESGLSRERAASEAATKYEALTELIRIAGADLKGSLLSWYDSYVNERVKRVPVPELLEAFQETHRAIKAVKLSPAKYRRIGHQYFKQAVKAVRRPRRAGFRQIT